MTCAIAVMAKAPRLGKVKTRLSPPLLPEEATQMSAAFLRDITENIQIAARQVDIAGFVAYAPAGFEAMFDGLLADGTELVLADGTGDMPAGVEGFGRSLLHATRALFAQGFGSVCVLNSDSPTLPTGRLVQAVRALERPGDHAVLGAADDGGYYILGMTASHAEFYTDIAWSTAAVAEQTRRAIHHTGIALTELEPWYDVDDQTALVRLLGEANAAGPGYGAPATAACVDRLGLRSRLA